jgi:acetyl-CoA carboxylase carboxyltransferase component
MTKPAPDETDPHHLAELQRRREKALAMGGAAKVERLRSLGKSSVRERIASLLDGGTFREVGLLATSDLSDVRDKTAADGKVCGFGRIEGRPVYVSGDDVTVLAGAGGRVGVKKDHDAIAT